MVFEREPNNSLSQAQSVSSNSDITGSVSSKSINDFFRFQVGTTSTFSATLSGLSSDADLRLIKDGNGNGNVDAGDTIVGSFRGGAATDSITAKGLVSGQYFVQVNKFGSGSTSYNLKLKTTSGLGQETEPVTDLGNINASRFFKGSVNNSTGDTEDLYKFQVNSASDSEFTAALGSKRKAFMQLWFDKNGDGRINGADGDRFQGSSSDSGFITRDNLVSGSYLLRVAPRSGQFGRVDYDIFAGATPNA